MAQQRKGRIALIEGKRPFVIVDADTGLGGAEASDNRLPTQKAVRDAILASQQAGGTSGITYLDVIDLAEFGAFLVEVAEGTAYGYSSLLPSLISEDNPERAASRYFLHFLATIGRLPYGTMAFDDGAGNLCTAQVLFNPEFGVVNPNVVIHITPGDVQAVEFAWSVEPGGVDPAEGTITYPALAVPTVADLVTFIDGLPFVFACESLDQGGTGSAMSIEAGSAPLVSAIAMQKHDAVGNGYLFVNEEFDTSENAPTIDNFVAMWMQLWTNNGQDNKNCGVELTFLAETNYHSSTVFGRVVDFHAQAETSANFSARRLERLALVMEKAGLESPVYAISAETLALYVDACVPYALSDLSIHVYSMQ